MKPIETEDNAKMEKQERQRRGFNPYKKELQKTKQKRS